MIEGDVHERKTSKNNDLFRVLGKKELNQKFK